MKAKFTIHSKKMHNAMFSNFNGFSIEPKYNEENEFFGIEPKYEEDEDGKYLIPDYWLVEGDFTVQELIMIGRLQERTNDSN